MGLGYSEKASSKLGFFIKRCGIRERLHKSRVFHLVGSEKKSVGENCLLDKRWIDIDKKMLYSDGDTWSKSDFYLEFSAFRFPNSGSLTAFCDIRMCLEPDCSDESVQICSWPYSLLQLYKIKEKICFIEKTFQLCMVSRIKIKYNTACHNLTFQAPKKASNYGRIALRGTF